MTATNRFDEFRAVQRESMRVAAELRKVLASVCLAKAPSPVQGGFYKSPSPFRGGYSEYFLPVEWDKSPVPLSTVKVTDRCNSRLPC